MSLRLDGWGRRGCSRNPLFKPALITNQARYVFSVPSEVLSHLTAYQDANGHSVSLRQLLSMQVRERRTPYKEASFGRLHLVRNTPDELICVHNEMLSRLLGTYVESDEVLLIRQRFEETYRDFGQVAPRVSGEFLLRQRHLIL